MMGLWLKFKFWIVGIGAAFLAAGGLILKAFLAGKQSERDKATRETVKRVEKAREIENDTEMLSDSAVVDELTRHGWVRDEDTEA